MEEGSNFLKDGVKATIGHAGKVSQVLVSVTSKAFLDSSYQFLDWSYCNGFDRK